LRLEVLEDRQAPAVFTVTRPGDSGPGTLRQAILDANDETAHPGPDTITFAPALAGATIMLTTTDPAAADGPSAFAVSSSITIDGGSASVTVARSAAGGTPAFRLFDMAGSGNLTLQHLTLRGGLAPGGGNVSSTGEGGAIFNGGSLTVSNCILAGNSASGAGGAIFLGGTATVSNSTLAGNSATYNGGGIAVSGGSVTVSNSTLAGNSASPPPGYVGSGGGISVSGGSVTVSNSTLAANSTVYGGGISVGTGGSVTVSNSTLGGNSASSGGGGIYAQWYPPPRGGPLGEIFVTVSNSTLSGNSASILVGGGGICVNGDKIYVTFTLRNTLVARNTLTDGVTPSDVSGGLDTPDSWNNLIGTGGSGGLTDGVQGNRVGVRDPGLAPLGDNGGPTQTMALLPGSPAVNAGSNAFVTPGATDQRGLPRIAGGTVDIGAFESQNPTFPAATVATCDPGTATWYLRNTNSAGFPDVAPFRYGAPGWLPVVGDWDRDGIATVGVFDPSTATWYLRNTNSAGAPDVTPFQFGAPGWVPVVGDWGGTGHAGIGVFDPNTGTWYLRNEDGAGAPDAGVFRYGGAGWMPVVGDWNGDGKTTVGVVDPASETWYLRNSNSAGAPDAATPFQYGLPGWTPMAGDWNGDGRAGIGVYYGTGFYLRNEADAGWPDVAPFPYGLAGWTPVAGAWTTPATTTQAAATSRGVSSGLATDILATGVGRTPALDQIFASFKKAKETTTDTSGVNDNFG
jgi:hypothetical protein